MNNQKTPNTKIAERIQKLLNLADGTHSEEEANSAIAKVEILLAEYNLSMVDVDTQGHSAKMGAKEEETKREKSNLKQFAMYEYQQNLFQAIAKANFCLYNRMSKMEWHHPEGKTKGRYKTLRWHRLIGSEVNVIAATMMFEYMNKSSN